MSPGGEISPPGNYNESKLMLFIIKKFRLRFIIYMLIIAMTSFGCKKENRYPVYEEAGIKIYSIDFISKDLFVFSEAVRCEETIFILYRFDVWKINLLKQTEEKIVKNGPGPDEIYCSYRCRIFDDYCWISSLYPNKSLFRFKINDNKFGIETIKLPRPDLFDDFIILPGGKIAGVYVYWPDALLKILDLENGTFEKCGKPIYNDIMMKFNVNTASIAAYKDNIYVIQSIAPIIEVFSMIEGKKIDTIKLCPPFYKKIPVKYNVNKDDNKAHKKWMAGWTSLFKIMADNGWILLQYKKGYEPVFYYELMNIKNRNKRFYVPETGEFIFDFKVLNNRFYVMTGNFKDDNLLWKRGEIILNR